MDDWRIADADGLADNTDPALVVIDITRQEIESGSIASTLERLHVLTDSRENVLRYRESMLFQVSGYDGDPRELPEIPEVRAFFKRLNEEWPHWMWFLLRGVGGIGLLMGLLCDVRMIRYPDGSYGTELLDEDLAGVLDDMFRRGNALFEAYGIELDDATESANTAMDDLLGQQN